MEAKKLREELESFKKHLVLQYSLRPITIKGHTDNIKRMLTKLESTNPEKEDVLNYVYDIRNSGKSTSHQCNTISSIEKYMDFKRQLMRFAKPRRVRKLIIEILTEAEISRMVSFCKNIREVCMILVLAYSGMRNKSFCELKVKDLDIGNNLIYVKKSKGKKEYPANIPSVIIGILVKYIEEYKKKSEDYLFTTIVKDNQYKPSDLRKFVKTLAKRCKIEKRVFPHLFRHSLTSHMRDRGADIIIIKEQLGQDWIESTLIYLSRFPNRIKSEYEVYKPAYL